MSTKSQSADYAQHPGQKVVTTGTGYFKPGLEAKIESCGGMREVFLGAECSRHEVAEFTLIFPNGSRREFCQAGRDFTIAA